ncbi:MAG TPA: hypothetical protein VEY91_02930 [Candidatus Limnocylindria bacterium]|nr:hypothetical protein [Candidatus Limnocylindria bacterium]
MQIADQVRHALGGGERWDSLAGVRWSFEYALNDTIRTDRRHAWDKRTGWHRVEGKNRAGQRLVIVHRISQPEGRAWVDGKAIEGDSLQKLLKLGTSLWINDAYWAFMPYKLRDPGVTVKMDGESRANGKMHDRLALTFADVGETPGDRYWVSVDRATHRIETWEMVLEGNQPPADTWTLEGWEEHGRLWFPTAKRNGNRTVYTRHIETVEGFPPGTFDAL